MTKVREQFNENVKNKIKDIVSITYLKIIYLFRSQTNASNFIFLPVSGQKSKRLPRQYFMVYSAKLK